MRDYLEKNFKYKNHSKLVYRYIIKCTGIFKNPINFKQIVMKIQFKTSKHLKYLYPKSW